MAHAEINDKLRCWVDTLKWTDDGLKYEADERHQQALLRRLGLSEKSTTVSSDDSKKDQELLATGSATKFKEFGSDSELPDDEQVRCTVRDERTLHGHGETYAGMLEETEESTQE